MSLMQKIQLDTMLRDCAREVQELHGAFVSWFRGLREMQAITQQLTQKLQPSFSHVAPNGQFLEGRHVLLGHLEDKYACYKNRVFQIDIYNVQVVWCDPTSTRCLCTYEEWQSWERDDEEDDDDEDDEEEEHDPNQPQQFGRLSSCLLERVGTTGEWTWVHVHETWLEAEAPAEDATHARTIAAPALPPDGNGGTPGGGLPPGGAAGGMVVAAHQGGRGSLGGTLGTAAASSVSPTSGHQSFNEASVMTGPMEPPPSHSQMVTASSSSSNTHSNNGGSGKRTTAAGVAPGGASTSNSEDFDTSVESSSLMAADPAQVVEVAVESAPPRSTTTTTTKVVAAATTTMSNAATTHANNRASATTTTTPREIPLPALTPATTAAAPASVVVPQEEVEEDEGPVKTKDEIFAEAAMGILEFEEEEEESSPPPSTTTTTTTTPSASRTTAPLSPSPPGTARDNGKSNTNNNNNGISSGKNNSDLLTAQNGGKSPIPQDASAKRHVSPVLSKYAKPLKWENALVGVSIAGFDIGTGQGLMADSSWYEEYGPGLEKLAQAISIPKPRRKIGLPEMVFPTAHVVLEGHGLWLSWDVIDALEAWAKCHRRIAIHSRIACQGVNVLKTKDAKLWEGKRKYVSEDEKSAAVFHYDWTFSTPFCGKIEGGEWIEIDESGMRMELLMDQSIPILFFDEVTLFEDDLHDNGQVQFTIKLRVMPSCAYILARFWCRVDNVIIRLRETRVLVDFFGMKPQVYRDVTWRECLWENLGAHGLPNDVRSWHLTGRETQAWQAQLQKLPQVDLPKDLIYKHAVLEYC